MEIIPLRNYRLSWNWSIKAKIWLHSDIGPEDEEQRNLINSIELCFDWF